MCDASAAVVVLSAAANEALSAAANEALSAAAAAADVAYATSAVAQSLPSSNHSGTATVASSPPQPQASSPTQFVPSLSRLKSDCSSHAWFSSAEQMRLAKKPVCGSLLTRCLPSHFEVAGEG